MKLILSFTSAMVYAIAGVIIFSPSVYPDNTQLRLKVSDIETGLPVDKVKIYSDNELIKYTDSLGLAYLNLSSGSHNLTFRRAGYKELEEKIEIKQGKDFIRIYLKPEGIKSPNVIVTGHYYKNEIDKITGENYAIEGNALKRNLKQTISESMADITGVTISSMGVATSRPILRGFGGNRVELQMNESIIADLSGTSLDHAVSPEVSSASKIEILRGVDALKRSTNAAVGLVKITGNQIPVEKHEKPSFQTILLGESVNEGFSASGSGDYTLGNIGLHGEGSYRKFDNMITPVGKLGNSNGEAGSFAFGSSYIGQNFVSGGSFTSLSNSYGVPGGVVGAHPNGVNIDMVYRNINLRSIIHIHSDLFDNIDINFSRTYYHHYEYEYSGILGAEFKLVDYFGNVDFSKKSDDLTNNIDFGISFNSRNHTYGAFVFTPNTELVSLAAYYTQKLDYDRFTLQYGSRIHYSKYEPLAIKSKTEPPRNREMLLLSGAVSGALKTSDNSHLILHLGRNNRQPSIEELYSGGPHLASYTYEIGNSNLSPETSYSVELSYDQNIRRGNFFITAYLNEYSSYITFRNTGDTNWAQFLPIFSSSEIKARIAGIEANFKLDITRTFQFNSGLSINYGHNLSDDIPLPFFPPAFGNIGLKYRLNGFGAGVNTRFALEQTRIDRFESTTDGYIVLGGFAEYKFQNSGLFHDITLAFDNVLNSEYYNHLSRLKEIIPEAGRNIRLIYRILY
ncbi:MAG: TonB-dependent receptor [Candidatus Kapabacteria bacterium]|nr:TonB-dependent receptor [Ignavibacteriota bacterium]MCW5884322.1 TonB-dependent receptor [Candidatus Kapabacteria bacterium]